jgi:hypothetical protein
MTTVKCWGCVSKLRLIEVEERFLLHWVHMLGDHTTVDQRIQETASVLPYLTDAVFPFEDNAAVRA